MSSEFVRALKGICIIAVVFGQEKGKDMDTSTFRPYEELSYGPLDPKVSLEPDFFSDFVAERRAEIVEREASFYRKITEPYSVSDQIDTSWTSFTSSDGVEIPIKCYRPRSAAPSDSLPCVMFFHGGGWKTCSVETHDYVPSYLAAHAQVMCLSVEYRLAPEHKFPCGLEDCYAACMWASSHASELGLDHSRMVVAGDSSGGNFAAVVAQMAQKRGNFSLTGQVLIYPVCDLEDLVVQKRSPGIYGPLRGEDLGPSPLACDYLSCPEEQVKDPRFAPLLAEDLSGLPPALFILAECDSLVDDGLYYAQRLVNAGVDVKVRVWQGMPHAFILRTYEETFEALETIAAWLKERFFSLS